MGMNNQLMTNFAMDETAMKIKAIIDPYEKKIMELEKIIRQKDFEILVLKEKLDNYKNNQMNMNNMNNMNNQINMNNQMDMNMNNQMNMNNMGNMMNPNMMMNNIGNNWMNIYNNQNNNKPNFFNPNNQNNDFSKPKINLIFTYKNMEYKEYCNYDEKIKKSL